MTAKVAIIGGTGYGGAELIRRLLVHPGAELVRVTAADNIGKRLGDVHFNLEGCSELRYEQMPVEEAVAGVDVAFLALPHKISAHEAPRILERAPGIRLIDLSGDFRLRDLAAYETFYAKHPHPEYLGRFAYGLPELFREQILASRWIASPGCFATATILALAAAAKAGWLSGNVRVVGCTGSSGSGANPSLGTHHPLRSQNLKSYKVLNHQHVPEIVQALQDVAAHSSAFALDFVPISAPLARGILITAFLDVDAALTRDAVLEGYRRAFAGEPFVRVLDSRLPEVIGVAGTNYVEVGFELGAERGGRRPLVCMSALDNLVKGGAGQAIQSFNLIQGFEESTTLSDPGLWP
ncbi:MAG: N-acetyl-gamma-glutamyl-phosphate reductase [Myxococcales bacterium]|nr:N-acetyl-gamma-glutamyl-phosphate reductase [Myxococcales bacterium]